MMLREVLKSKVNKAVITKTELFYEGSIGIDKAILARADIVAGEKVQVLNYNSGARFETYAIEEEENSGAINLYGPAAKIGRIGDEVCVLSYVSVSVEELDKVKPKILTLDKENRLVD